MSKTRLYTLSAAANFLDLSEAYVRQLVYKSAISSVVHNGIKYIAESELVLFKTSREVKTLKGDVDAPTSKKTPLHVFAMPIGKNLWKVIEILACHGAHVQAEGCFDPKVEARWHAGASFFRDLGFDIAKGNILARISHYAHGSQSLGEWEQEQSWFTENYRKGDFLTDFVYCDGGGI